MMKVLQASISLALVVTASSVPAQNLTSLNIENVASLNLEPDFTLRVFENGTLVTPASSVLRPGAAGMTAHTNVRIFLPTGMTAVAAAGPASGPPVPGLLFETPASLACAYNLVPQTPGCNPNMVSAVPTGGSKVIAIVDAFHAPNALADLTTFSKQFGLPAPTSKTFEVVYASANGTQTTTPPRRDSGWELEISLDIEWAHAMAPSSKIILVEAASNSIDDLMGAEDLASKLVAAAGGGEISNSWGSGEFAKEASFDSHFSTNQVVYFASTGDSPGTSWPSVSTKVVAVGGTSISRDPTNGTFVGEASWSEAGGGRSAYIGLPPYQNAISGIIGDSHRGVPDVSAVANPRTGVWVYDQGSGGWIIVGGTSAASPVFAAITNNAGQFRRTTALELSEIYTNHAMLRDITQGICGPNTGFWAMTGWDFCGGVGSPNGIGAE
jgi:subtilase family serine protease